MRLKHFCILVFLFFVVSAYFVVNRIYFRKDVFNLIYVEPALDKNIEIELVNLLNANKDLKKLKNKKYDIYVGGFFESFEYKIKNNDNFNILRLGSFNKINLELINKFDLILTSSNDLTVFLNSKNINSHILPLYSTYNNKSPVKCVGKDCYWVIFGEQTDVEKYMISNNILYKKYNNIDDANIINENDYNNLLGVIVGKSRISDVSYDVNPLFLEFIIRKIPILTNDALGVNKSTDSLISFLFSDAIAYYSYDTDIDYFFKNSTYREDKINYAYKYFVNFLSVGVACDKILNFLYNENTYRNIASIFSPTPVGLYNNGDYWIAKDIESEFDNLGYKSLVYFPTSTFSNIGDFNIYIRGGMPLRERIIDKNKTSIMYLLFPFIKDEEKIKNLDELDFSEYFLQIKQELDLFDAVAVASIPMVEWLKQNGVNAFFVPQFTNTNKFYYDFDEKLKSDILFVGNNTFYRKAPSILIKNNIPVTIYGNGWGDKAKAKYVDNKILRKYYSSAKIVLNDTRDVMKKFGFIINRIFDVSASGGFIISDYVKEVEDIFGDSIVMYKNEDELVKLVKYYLDPKNENERIDKINRAREITLKYFTSKQVIDSFINIDKMVRLKKGI